VANYPLTSQRELGENIRTDGRYVGPLRQTLRICSGRPPVQPDGRIFPLLSLSLIPGEGAATPPIGTTVTIEAEGASGNGGRVRRTFQIGAGLTGDIMMGYYEHVRVKALPNADGVTVPEGMVLYFVWNSSIYEGRRLQSFLNYAIPASIVPAPEGTEFIIPETACVLTFQLPSFSTTFVYTAAAGERVPAAWGAFSCNIANKFIFILKPL